MTRRTQCLAFAVFLAAHVVYQVLAVYPSDRYLKWAAPAPECAGCPAQCQRQLAPLPDIVLDLVDNAAAEASAWTPIADAIPTLLLGVAIAYNAVRTHPVVLNCPIDP